MHRPSSFSESLWNDIVREIIWKANKKMGSEEIDSKEQKAVLSYLVTIGTSS